MILLRQNVWEIRGTRSGFVRRQLLLVEFFAYSRTHSLAIKWNHKTKVKKQSCHLSKLSLGPGGLNEAEVSSSCICKGFLQAASDKGLRQCFKPQYVTMKNNIFCFKTGKNDAARIKQCRFWLNLNTNKDQIYSDDVQDKER